MDFYYYPLDPNSEFSSCRLQDIFGKDTTYDFDYIKSLKSGPVEDAGYEGLPKVLQVLTQWKQ